MAFDPRRLRKWFAAGAVFLALVVAAFYGYNKVRAWTITQAAQKAGKKLGVDVQQSAQGWTISKSEGGRTLFTVRASNALQYKEGGRAELDEVNIIIYGRQSNRFDQINGRKFSYDPKTEEVRAEGQVHIDLESNAAGPVTPDQAPPQELKNPIHLLTSGLAFNRNTGMASTDQTIEFRVPQASGTARGATYDSKQNLLTIQSDIHIKTTGPDPANISASHGVITGDVPRQAVLDHARVERAGGAHFDADKLTIFIRDDNKIDHMVAAGNVRVHAEGETPVEARAPQATFQMTSGGPQDMLKTAALTGGVQLESGGKSPMNGTAGRVTVDFAGRNVAQAVHAAGGVRLIQHGTSMSAQATEIVADGVEMRVADGKYIASALTQGKAEITVKGGAAGGTRSRAAASTPLDTGETVITAGKFEAQFGKDNRMKSLHGAPDAKITSRTPGQPERVTTSRELDVTFGSGAGGGGISGITQSGDFRYVEGTRTATAQKARYNVGDNTIVATGSPRVTDTNLELTANAIRLNRVTGDLAAEGEVKTTYQQSGTAQPGAMFSSADPLHATAPAMTAKKNGQAHYSGGARLWQGANIVEGPTIDFDRERRTLVAQGTATQPVSTVFVQADKSGKMTPVNVTARKLTYSDQARQARFEGGVVLKGTDTTINADHADVVLHPRSGAGGAGNPAGGASQLEKIVAEGAIEIRQATRRATGTKLVYTAADARFVLTGSEGKLPSIFDAERGTITGDSLTFYSHDDKVVVGSGQSSRTVTQTRVKP